MKRMMRTYPHSPESSSSVFTFNFSNMIQMFSFNKDRHQESLHLLCPCNKILERFKEIFELLDPRI